MPAKRTSKATTSRTAAPAKRTTPAAKKAAPVKAAKAATTRTSRKAAAAAVEAVATTTPQDQFALFLNDLKGLADRYLSTVNGDVDDTADENTPFEPDEPATADEDGEDEPQTREEREAELNGWTVRQIQNALIALKDDDGEPMYDAADIKAEKDKEVLIENLLDEEFSDGDDEDDAADEAEEEEDDEDAEYTEEELTKLSLAELRKLAVNEFEIDAAEVKGKDKDTIVELILDAQDGEDETDDEYEGDDEEEEADEDADEEWTEEELNELSIAELRGIASEGGVAFTAAQGKSKAKMIELILA